MIMLFNVFGEILWDVFGDSKEIGGAPFNFAAHSVKMGAKVCFISAVGKDELGDEALSRCEKLNIPTDCIVRVASPTGKALVTLEKGTPSYELVEGVSYDNIPAMLPVEIPDVFYFGTLAQRSSASADSLKKILEITASMETSTGKTPLIFFDINIRQHYYNNEIIERSMKAATILKVSREEIGVFGLFGSLEEICGQLFDLYPNLQMIIVTLDSDGAFAAERDGAITYSPKTDCKVVSTVGAGDSFSAAFLVSYINGETIEASLEMATKVAGFVCEHTEAIPDYPDSF